MRPFEPVFISKTLISKSSVDVKNPLAFLGHSVSLRTRFVRLWGLA
jgi:hypothetical protein